MVWHGPVVIRVVKAPKVVAFYTPTTQQLLISTHTPNTYYCAQSFTSGPRDHQIPTTFISGSHHAFDMPELEDITYSRDATITAVKDYITS